MTLRSTSLLVLALVAACSDRDTQSVADSASLAADLALAQQTPVTPRFADTALVTTPAGAPARTPPPRATPRPPTQPRRTATAPAPRIDSTPLRVAEQPAPAPEPAPVSRFRGIGAGVSFGLATNAQVCTTNRPGDKIIATLTQPVTGENGAHLPAGTVVVLEVASVTPGDTPESASIGLRVRSIDINEQAVPVEADVSVASALERREVPRPGNSDKKKVIGGAIAGAVIGQIMGRDTKSTVIGAAAGAATGAAVANASKKYDACLPAGGSVRVTTTRQIAISA